MPKRDRRICQALKTLLCNEGYEIFKELSGSSLDSEDEEKKQHENASPVARTPHRATMKWGARTTHRSRVLQRPAGNRQDFHDNPVAVIVLKMGSARECVSESFDFEASAVLPLQKFIRFVQVRHFQLGGIPIQRLPRES